MATSKKLKSIAHNLLNSFISRNNDIKGYWALGKLYNLAFDNNSKTITIDLLSMKLSYISPQFHQMILHYRSHLENQINKIGLYFELLKSAIIEINFDNFDVKPNLDLLCIRGNPFTCKMTLIYAENKCFSSIVTAFCAPHDPAKENRSTRYNGE